MKRTISVAVTSILISACGAPSSAPAPHIKLEKGTAKLQATITPIKKGSGPLRCALFNEAEGFPGPSPIIDGDIESDPSAESLTVSYGELPSGDYALTCFQDENNNGVLDTNAFGAPTEGYGASNNKLPAAAPPSFDESKVTLTDNQSVELTITLRR